MRVIKLTQIATITEEFKRFVKGGNYEDYILKLMNASQFVFPGQYEKNNYQSAGECDFYDVNTKEKYEAKLPFDKKEGELICSNNGSIAKWIKFMMDEESEFGELIIRERGKHQIEELQLYKTLEKRLNSIETDENAILFFPFPITFDMAPIDDEVCIFHLVSDILDSLFSALKANGIVGSKKMFVMYPTMDEKIAVRCLNSNKREYIECTELNDFFKYSFSL